MILNRLKYNIATWWAEKKVGTYEDVFTDLFNDMLFILMKFKAYDLFEIKSYSICRKGYSYAKDTIVISDKDEPYSLEYWMSLIESNESYLSIEFEGTTVINEGNKSGVYEKAIYLSFSLENDSTEQSEVTCCIDIKADDFAPNFLINRCDTNPNYEKNHGRLNACLKEMEAYGYEIASGYISGSDLAKVVGLEIHNNIDDENDYCYFDNEGVIIDFVKLQ